MISTNLSPLTSHLWQSTLCSATVWLLTLALKENRAAVRYWLWLGASVKFLIPFSLLVGLGSRLGLRTAPAVLQAQWSFVVRDIGGHFATVPPALQAGPSPSGLLPALLFGVWLFGFVVCTSRWLWCWRQMRSLRKGATRLTLDLPIPVMSSPTHVEPGVLGIFRPSLLLPAGITDRLTPPQLGAILEHEICHVRRYDNLTAAIHMLVEAVFWFYPLVWLIRGRLVEERELACDEAVLESGSDAEVYAEGILNVCKFYVEVPLACVSGTSGADLKQRVVRILTERRGSKLDFRRMLLLGAAGSVVIGAPIVFGLVNAEASGSQSLAEKPAAVIPVYNSVSIKPAKSASDMVMLGSSPDGLTANGATLQMLIQMAYGVADFQILGGPNWLTSERYDVGAKAGASAAGELQDIVSQRMLQALLVNRFRLMVHRETKEFPVYALVTAKGGPILKKSKPGIGLLIGQGQLISKGGSLGMLVDRLSRLLGRPILDKTGLTGNYDFTMRWEPESQAPIMSSSDSFGPSILTVLEEQIGLKLESQELPVDVLVIDRAEKPSAE